MFYTTDNTLPDRAWVVEGVLGDRLSTIIKDLTPKTTYFFKVQARNSKGYGPMSPTVIFKTPNSEYLFYSMGFFFMVSPQKKKCCSFVFHDIPSLQLSPTSQPFIFIPHGLVQFTSALDTE